jgi:hypothetical protein
MSEYKLSEEILHQINEKHISPKPKWEFWVKDWAVWTAGIISILVGGLAIGLIITFVRTDDWNIFSQTDPKGSGIQFALLLFPYFWLLVLIGFLVLARINIAHTKKGYRLTVPVFAGASIALSILLGICFYDAGLGQMLDSLLTERPGRYLEFIHPRADLWSRPEEGMLGGVIVGMRDPETIILQDFQNKPWIVHLPDDGFSADDLPIHARVRCIGVQIEDNEFVSKRILPWGSRRTILIPLPPPPNHIYFERPIFNP